MKGFATGVSVAVVLALGGGAAWAATTKTATKSAKPPVKKEMKIIAATDVAWKDTKDKGIAQSVLWGDAAKGSHGAFDKFLSGTETPMHTHTHDVHAVIVAGTLVEATEGGQPGKEAGPGAYLFIPSGLKHSTSCKVGADCVVFRWQPGPFDIKPVASAPAKK